MLQYIVYRFCIHFNFSNKLKKLNLLYSTTLFNVTVCCTEWEHHRAVAEGRLCSLCGLVHGCVHPGSREATGSRTVSLSDW